MNLNFESNLTLESIITLLLTLSFSLLPSCSSTTESGEVGADRRQLMLVSSDQITAMSEKSYDDVKKQAHAKGQLNQNAVIVERLKKISQRLIPHVTVFRKDASRWNWEINSITSQELNAYCMPGGKIMFYTGIIERLKLTDAEIAAVMGHEIAHALREHGRERMSQELAKQGALAALVLTGVIEEKYAGLANTAFTLSLTLPHGRGNESEADEIGLELMARAGYNPEEAVSLWKKMGAGGGQKPPEFLSTHPSDETRIKKIQSLLPKVIPLYRPAG